MMGFAPTPLQSIYPATKSFIIFFSEMLANELQGTGITVTCLCPGVTDTLFFERAGMVKSKVGKAKRDDAAGVAIFGYSALKKGKVLAIPLGWRYVPFAVRILPRNIFMKIGRHRSIEPA
jgi:short-subunit dehydrogenase